jgi:hypothetical protein
VGGIEGETSCVYLLWQETRLFIVF